VVNIGVTALGVLIAVLGGGLGLLKARSEWSLRREIKGAEGVDAGSLKRGVVELGGTTAPAGETFTSPLTGQECVAYEYEVEKLESRTGGSNEGSGRTWKTVSDVERAAPFYIEDGTGRAMVDAPVADFELECAHEVDTEDVSTGATGKLLATVTGGNTASDLPVTEERREEIRNAGRRHRYVERLIQPGESVFVYGEAIPPGDVPRSTGGLSSLAGMVAGSESASGSVLGGVVSGMGGDRGGYRRAKRRGADRSEVGPSESEVESRREEFEHRGAELEAMEGTDPDDMTDAERRRMMEMVEEMQEDFGVTQGSIGSSLDDVAAAMSSTGEDDPFAGEGLVVSRGETIGEFVVSDREKGQVLRSYSTNVLKWTGIAIGSLAVGGVLVANGVGVLSFDSVASLAAGWI
jgi:hypothetical protein